MRMKVGVTLTFDELKQLYLNNRFDCAVSERYVTGMLSEANKKNDTILLGMSCYYQAELYYYKNMIPTSELLCNRALAYFKGDYIITEKILCNNLLGILSDIKGNTILALDCFLKALCLAENYNEKSLLSVVYNNLADMHMRVHNYEESIVLLQKSIEYLDEEQEFNRQRLFYAYLNLCYCYNGLNEIQQFERCMKETERLYHSNKNMCREKMHLFIMQTIMQCRKQNLAGVQQAFSNVFNNLQENLQIENIEHFLMAIPYWLAFDRDKEAELILESCSKVVEENDIMKIRSNYYAAKISLFLKIGRLDEAKELALKFVSISSYVDEEQRNLTAKSIIDRISLHEMQKRYNKAEKKAITDSLTKIYNRHAFKSILIPKFELCKQRSLEVAVVLLDIDNFKAYNDHYGHIEGDNCLKQVSRIIRDMTDDNIIAVRYGGDEFILLLCNISRLELSVKLKELQANVDSLHIKNEKSSTGYVTVTQGVCHAVPYEDENIYDFVLKADRSLYRGKQDRDCISF